jgi:hypothetical protein
LRQSRGLDGSWSRCNDRSLLCLSLRRWGVVSRGCCSGCSTDCTSSGCLAGPRCIVLVEGSLHERPPANRRWFTSGRTRSKLLSLRLLLLLRPGGCSSLRLKRRSNTCRWKTPRLFRRCCGSLPRPTWSSAHTWLWLRRCGLGWKISERRLWRRTRGSATTTPDGKLGGRLGWWLGRRPRHSTR